MSGTSVRVTSSLQNRKDKTKQTDAEKRKQDSDACVDSQKKRVKKAKERARPTDQQVGVPPVDCQDPPVTVSLGSTSSHQNTAQSRKETLDATRNRDPTAWAEMQKKKGEKIKQTLAANRDGDPDAWAEMQKKKGEKLKQTLAAKRDGDPDAWAKMQKKKGEKIKQTLAAKRDGDRDACVESQKNRVKKAKERAGPAHHQVGEPPVGCQDPPVTVSPSSSSSHQTSTQSRKETLDATRNRDPTAWAEMQKKKGEKIKQTLAANRDRDPDAWAEMQKKKGEKIKQTLAAKRDGDPVAWAEMYKKRTDKAQQTLAEARAQGSADLKNIQKDKRENTRRSIKKKRDVSDQDVQKMVSNFNSTSQIENMADKPICGGDQLVGETFSIVPTELQVESRKLSQTATSTPRKNQCPKLNRRSHFQNPEDDGSELFQDKWPTLIKKYFAIIRQGPTHVCTCCRRLFYRDGVRNVVKQQLRLWKINDAMMGSILYKIPVDSEPVSSKQLYKLCITCYNTATTGKVPALSLSNGLDFPEIPEAVKGLTQLEERCVAPRLPFMQIRLTGFQQQWSLRGNVVNVENNINTCVTALPRDFTEMTVVQLKLMRRMNYKLPYLYDKIRPAKIMSALKYLIKTPLYEEEHITLSENWDGCDQDYEIPFVVDDEEAESRNIEGILPDSENEAIAEIFKNSNDNGVVDDDQTLLFIDDVANIGIRIAPAEENTPLPLYRDPNAELLSFPTIYCGQPRNLADSAKLSTTDIVKSELMRDDRRCCRADKLFWCFKKSYNEKVRDAYNIVLRQKPSHFQGNLITAGMAREPGYIRDLITKDDGYAVFKNVRSTPAYWKETCKRLTSMIRQLGVPAFFITLSAAESRWSELLVLLSTILKNQLVGEEETKQFSFEERAKLIRDDPVTCMRHFDHKYRALLNKLLKPTDGVFAPYGVEDWFSRIEYQMRGSPHSHGIYWLKNAPTYNPDDPDSETSCVNFIDKYITCKRDEEGDMAELIAYQLHRHTHTCFKTTRRAKCRFHYPKPPMIQTTILHPLPTEISTVERDRLCEIYKKVAMQLDAWGREYVKQTTVEDMLRALELSTYDYLNAIRTTIKRRTVFLKRLPRETFINAYNRKIMVAWKANMDIQFVLDGYACGKYVASYISKSGGGVSKLLRAAAADVNDGNSHISNKLQKFASILITGCEISAQEAAAFCLGTAMISCSRAAEFINTSISTNRIRMLKPQKDLNELPENSDDIYIKGIADRYGKRPLEMENVCFAEFVCCWSKENHKRPKGCTEEADVPNDTLEENYAPFLESQDKITYIKRDRSKILRFCNFSKITSPNDYWREQIMLFLPWRNESRDVEGRGDFAIIASQEQQTILENSRPYYKLRENLESLEGPEPDDYVDPNDTYESDDEMNSAQEVHDEDEQTQNMAYVQETISNKRGPTAAKFLPPKLIDADAYTTIMRSLNNLQRKFVFEILHLLKTRKLPFYYFLSGGAGVGKSHVITAIVQSYMRHCNRLAQVDPDAVPVIVCAPTGKAAFNVFGMTLHNVFRLPPSQYRGPIAPLDESIANTLRRKFRHTDLFIIDEVSMVGAIQLQYIDARLRQLFDKDKIFGGKSILVVGHMRQLPPVAMSYVFQCPKLRGAEATRSQLVGRHPLWEPFKFFELTEIMRQRDAHLFCKALNNMSEGQMDEEDIALIKSRVVKKEDAPKDAVWLFRTNPECAKHNAEIHGQMQTDSATSIAIDKVTGHQSEYDRYLFQEAAKDFNRSESDGLFYIVPLQVGGIYFVTTNIDVSDGLFNGATGVLKAIEYSINVRNENEQVPTSAWMEFAHPSIGQELRRNPSYLPRTKRLGYPTSWTPINRMCRRINKTFHGMQITRKQIPIQAANGMTIHKSQGSSLSKVVLTIRAGLSRESLYVACSRAITLDGFYIVGEFEPPESPGLLDDVSKEMKTLQNNPLGFRLHFPELTTFQNKLYFHNIEGYLQHQADLKADNNIMLHNHIFLVEPRITESCRINLEGFTTVFRHNSSASNGHCNSEGILLFSKNSTPIPHDVHVVTKMEGRKHCILLIGRLREIVFISTYKHPEFSRRNFLELLGDKIDEHKNDKQVVFGDMNIDLTNPANRSVVDFFQTRNLLPALDISEFTTEFNTHLDVCFSNFPTLEAFVYENYYSYHKGLSIRF